MFTKTPLIAFAAMAILGLAFSAGPAPAKAQVSAQFTRDLTMGSSGTDVAALQSFLEARGHLVIPAGTAKGYFGSLTKAALARYQAAQGISPAVGYFGPVTRTSVSAFMGTGNPTTPNFACPAGFTPGVFNGVNVCLVTPGNPTTPTNNNNLSGEEASLSNFDVRNGEDTDLEEGESDAEIMDIRFNVRDADIRVNRMDVHFQANSGNEEDDPWKVFKTVTILHDGDEVAEVRADRQSDWSRVGRTSPDTYRLRVSNIDEIVRSGDTAEFTVAVTLQSSLDIGTDRESWRVFIPNDGIRSTDAAGITQTIGNINDVVTVDIGEAGQNEELSIREADNNPDARTIQVNSNNTSNLETVFSFEIEAEDNDIEITEIPLTLEFTGGTFNSIVNDLELVIDGETYDDFTVDNRNSGTTTVRFEIDRGDVVVEDGDTVTADLRIRFNRLSGNYAEGAQIQAYMTSANVDDIEAEGADDLDPTQLNGSVYGEIHSLRTQGVVVRNVSTPSPEYRKNVDNTSEDDQGIFTMLFDITAFEEPAFVRLDAFQGTESGVDAGVNYIVETQSNVAIASSTGSVSGVLERVSGGSVTGGYLQINEGQTARVRLTVYYNPEVTGFYRVQLYSVNFNSTAAVANQQQTVSPESTYQTPLSMIQS
jgi:peptidoglycan hydrolase-like protein with peptidoglycan-binding domain